ncbi:MAG: CDGSH iron-sulfur domain-containing protein [Chlorobium limicola]|jgi:CDGSH iron-sulfur domain-containing protein 3|uniref:Zinc finger CDGSH-type domain protein n=2 Tax=Chlorobium limicola TaxID=1092 RepID=B3EE76_CHLL2|nr:CDGSH iron-sulfur domain-containing protein [Chlorobium limicola]ACD89210.1 zinc finger CDGSH-type domain protein [Chlorobium limicola DSM 245]NTV21681.1 CDGSH iron-sulfur domain-containing protein [Chlorobium limicola]
MEPKRPYIIREQAGTTYYCACGKSQNKPYCDGAHEGSGLHPYKVEIEAEKNVAVCSCGLSAKMPFCDGAHKSIA